MTTLIEIADALKTRLAIVGELNVSIGMPGNITPPHAVIGAPTMPSYREAVSGARYTAEFEILLLTSATWDEVGMKRLMEFANGTGAYSINAALLQDPKLGSTVEFAKLRDFRPLTPDEHGAIAYFGGIFTVEVMAR